MQDRGRREVGRKRERKEGGRDGGKEGGREAWWDGGMGDREDQVSE